MKEYWTQLTLRMREKTRVRFPFGFLIIYYPYFPRNPCFSLNKLELQFFKKRNLCRKILKAKTLLVSALNKEHDWQRTATNLRIKKIVDWTFHLNRARPARCSVPALLCCLQKACLLALRTIFLGLLAGAKSSCNLRDTLSCMKKLFEMSRIKYDTLRKLIARPFPACFPPLVVIIHLNLGITKTSFIKMSQRY